MRKPSSTPISIKSAVSASRRAISRFSMQPAGYFLWQIRLDMNQNVRHPFEFLFNLDAHLGSNLVRFVNAHGRIHLQMQIHVPLQTGLAGKAFLDALGARDTEANLTDSLHGPRVRHGVDQLQGCLSYHTKTGKDNDQAYGGAAKMVGCHESFRIEKRKAQSH